MVAKKTAVKKPVKRTVKLKKWECSKGGAHYWLIPRDNAPMADGTPRGKRMIVGTCKKCQKTRRFKSKMPKK